MLVFEHNISFKGNGELIISCEELSMCKDEMELQFMAKKLDKKDFFGSSDPFLQLSRANESGGFTVVHRTEHVRNNVNPVCRHTFMAIRYLLFSTVFFSRCLGREPNPGAFGFSFIFSPL